MYYVQLIQTLSLSVNLLSCCVGEPDKAFEYTLDSFKAVKDVFGIISIEAAEELAKLTQLLYKRYVSL